MGSISSFSGTQSCSCGAPAYVNDSSAFTLIYIAELDDGSLDVTIVNHVNSWPMSPSRQLDSLPTLLESLQKSDLDLNKFQKFPVK